MQPEARLRARCRMWLDAHLPFPCDYTSVEHGRKHAGTADQRAREWQRLRAQGVKPGIGDMNIYLPKLVVTLELKAGKNDLSDAQKVWRDRFALLGLPYHVIRSVEALATLLVGYGVSIGSYAAQQAMAYDRELATPEKLEKARKPSKPRAPRVLPGTMAALARARAKGSFQG